MRPRLSPWYVFGIGLQRTLREPYLDADVQPSGEYWAWRVTKMGGDLVEVGLRPTRREACEAATAFMLKAKELHDERTTP
jgi:hypothetical protein